MDGSSDLRVQILMTVRATLISPCWFCYRFRTATNCQRFVGGNASAAMIAAVRTTEGQVLTDNRNQPIDSYFGASCGGETANVAELWGTKPASYLVGTRDEFCLSGPHAQ